MRSTGHVKRTSVTEHGQYHDIFDQPIAKRTLQENSHLAAPKNGRKLLKTAGKFKNWQN
jgi:hypothetical protein